MGWLTSIISGVFGNSKDGSSNVMKVAEGVGGWIDGQQFTEQEKAEYNAKIIESYAEYMKLTVDENTARSITRRTIAIYVIKVELFLLLASVVCYRIDEGMAEYIYKVATGEPMNYLVLGIGAFFFGSHLVRATKKN